MLSDMIWLALLLVLLAICLLWLANRQQKNAGLPGGQVIYADVGKWQKNHQALYDPKLDLTGKPDYLVYEKNGAVIPVEVKTGHTPSQPYDSHIFQLAAYCYLVESVLERKPPHGILHYPKKTFEIAYTQDLREALMDVLADMRLKLRSGQDVLPSHHSPARCAGCGYRNDCDQQPG